MSDKWGKFLIDNKMLLFMPESKKLAILNNYQEYQLTLAEKILLIKSLKLETRSNELKMLFKYYQFYGISLEETYEVFKNLSYKDKTLVLNSLYGKTYKKELISRMTKQEVCRFLINESAIYMDNYLRDEILKRLSIEELISLYPRIHFFYERTKTAILKKLPEKYIKEFLEKNKHSELYYVTYIRNHVICALTDDREKLALLKQPNKYNVSLSEKEKLQLIISLSDNEKLKFVTHENYCDVELSERSKGEIVRSVSDELKLTYLSSEHIIDEYYNGYLSELLESFSHNTSHKLLLERDKYDVFKDEKILLYLINNLKVSDRLMLLTEENPYNLKLSDEGLVQVIINLPDQIKMGLIPKYKDILTKKQITSIICSMRTNMALMTVIDNEDLIDDKKKIIDIIDALYGDEAKKIISFSNNNNKFAKFVIKYHTAIILCLDSHDKIEILTKNNKSNDILLDSEKLALISGKSGKEIMEFNGELDVLSFFSNPQIVIDYYLDNLEEFKELSPLIQKQLIKYYIQNNNLEITEDTMLAFLNYTKEPKELLANIGLFNEMFEKLKINTADFIQYGINSDRCDSNKIILNLLQSNDVENFLQVKNYFFEQYYFKNNDPKYTVEIFLELLDFYHHYQTLCLMIVNTHESLNNNEKETIYFLINQLDKYDDINTLEDAERLRNDQIKKQQEELSYSNDLLLLKDRLLSLLFSKGYSELVTLLKNTGAVADLEILKFNNRHNSEFVAVVDDVLIVTDLIERIINTNDISGLKKYISYFTSEENIEHTKKINSYCAKYQEYIRKLYEYDFQISLTKIDNIPDELKKTANALALKRKYSGEVIDLSNSNYVLAAHVKSPNESIENLLTGTSSGENNFISVSAISHRGQQYYWGLFDQVIFAYDCIPDNSFICSSSNNLGSNYVVKYHSAEVPEISRNQRGILEISECEGDNRRNSEALLYRQGLVPCGLIVPEGVTPSKDAIECHKKYKLPFIITQTVRQIINNPQIVNFTKNVDTPQITDIIDRDVLTMLKKQLATLSDDKNTPRRIAVLADPHALYEPTLACLLDIKNKGIEEIYSLGDNIGHGPSPKETLELLARFGVKSIYGNHELYLADHGLDNFKEHFPSQSSLERTEAMVKWIKEELNSDQLADIKKYPERYEINSETANPLTLIHTTDPYNRQGIYSTPPNIIDNSYVIQGHQHFARITSDKDVTLRAVGIGQNQLTNGFAAYAVVEFTQDGYEITPCYIPYNRRNLLHTINESTMPIQAKQLIKRWVG